MSFLYILWKEKIISHSLYKHGRKSFEDLLRVGGFQCQNFKESAEKKKTSWIG